MARPRRVDPPIPNGFVASAARLPVKNMLRVAPPQGWMGPAWGFYDTIGELRFVANWIGNMMSRAQLRAFHREDGAYELLTDGPAAEALESYFGGVHGQEQMLHQTGVHLTVPGECYHVMVNDEEWYVISSGNVQQDRQNRVTVLISGERHVLSGDELASRIWTPHPRDPDMADSPVRSNLSTLSEIKRLNEHVSAQLDSRLAGAGILFLPSEIQFAVPEGVDPQSNQADAFMSVLAEAMMTPILDRGSASAIVPIVVTAPGDSLSKVQHLTFWTELDDATIAMRDNAVKRLALGLDTPPEILLGTADQNHWSAWMVDESSIKSHLEPRLGVVAGGITSSYLQPSLEGVVPDPQNYVVMADTSSIRVRPNRSTEAIELYDRLALNSDALRRETGFNPEDAPDQDEFVQILLQKVATGAITPESAEQALNRLGAGIGAGGAARSPDNRTKTDSRVRSENIGRPPRGTQTENDQKRGLTAACDALVIRALERAGNKLCDAKGRANGIGKMPAHERYLSVTGDIESLMDGAWATAQPLLSRYTDDVDNTVASLDIYVRSLLSLQNAHDPEAMSQLLAAL